MERFEPSTYTTLLLNSPPYPTLNPCSCHNPGTDSQAAHVGWPSHSWKGWGTDSQAAHMGWPSHSWKGGGGTDSQAAHMGWPSHSWKGAGHG
eukprot:366052-Chlamydomonas_euryale.AAC.14